MWVGGPPIELCSHERLVEPEDLQRSWSLLYYALRAGCRSMDALMDGFFVRYV
jgi:hypothetical protein